MKLCNDAGFPTVDIRGAYGKCLLLLNLELCCIHKCIRCGFDVHSVDLTKSIEYI